MLNPLDEQARNFLHVNHSSTGSTEYLTYFQELPTNDIGVMTNACVATFVHTFVLSCATQWPCHHRPP